MRPDNPRKPIPQFIYLSIYDEWATMINRLVDIQDNYVCLDLASGKGTCAKTIALKARWVVGVDADMEMLSIARDSIASEGVQNIVLVRADANSLPLSSESIDVVTGGAALSNMNDPLRVALEAYRILKPGGVICIAEPVIDARTKEIWEVLSTFKYGYRRTYFSYHEIMNILRSSRFTPVKIEPMIWTRPLSEFLRDVEDSNVGVFDLVQKAIMSLDADTKRAIGIHSTADGMKISYECIVCKATKN